jgi:hypothetical protein
MDDKLAKLEETLGVENIIQQSTGDYNFKHPIVETQLSSLERTLAALRSEIIRGLSVLIENIETAMDSTKMGRVPMGVSYGDKLSKIDRLMIRYNELKNIAESIKLAIKLEKGGNNIKSANTEIEKY